MTTISLTLNPFSLFLLLLFAHFLFDFPLQGEFLALGKNCKKPLPGVPWVTPLFAHAYLHAIAVWLLTGSMICFVAELLNHFAIDYAKCAGMLGDNPEKAFSYDQTIHIVLKVVYVIGVFALGLR